MTDADRLVGLLATPERLRVVAAMVLGEESIPASRLRPTSTSGRRSRRSDASSKEGLVEHHAGTFVVLEAAFTHAARTARSLAEGDGPVDARARIQRRVFDGRGTGRRSTTKRATRRVGLDELAQRFEVGRRYSEREINASLARVAPRHRRSAALPRRRGPDGPSSGEYWRVGRHGRPRLTQPRSGCGRLALATKVRRGVPSGPAGAGQAGEPRQRSSSARRPVDRVAVGAVDRGGQEGEPVEEVDATSPSWTCR